MRVIEWAFEQQLPTAEKIVLVWLASNANSAGVGPMDRTALEQATGYKKRSAQRLLKSLRDSQHLVEHGIWYAIGNAGKITAGLENDLAQLPPAHQFDIKASADGLQINVDTDAIGEAIASHVTDAAEFMADQLQNFEMRFTQQIKRLAMLHVEHSLSQPPPAPPPDPVLENPLYGQLLETGMEAARAYKVSEADLRIGEVFANDTPPPAPDGEYPDDAGGRYERVVDILHGAHAADFHDAARHVKWLELETDENKHTKAGERDAFVLLYPAIVAAAKANVGKLSIDEFLDPHIESRAGFKKAVTHGVYVWDQELDPIDKDDPAMLTEIAIMLAELEQANDPRCQVHARTREEGDDGVVREETVLGYYRRVKAKRDEMTKMQDMGVFG